MQKREHFGSRWAAVLAMAGSAIGLGNIWRFPYIVGEHGGAAFVLLYIVATLLVSLPVFIAEVTLGRRSRSASFGSMSGLCPNRRLWVFAGWLSVIIPTLIASYYSVIGGWSVDYLLKALTAQFVRTDPMDAEKLFPAFMTSTWGPLLFHFLFLSTSLFIVARGVRSGIEKFSKLSIPVLFVLILGMIAYSVSLPGAGAGVRYLVKPDFSQITARSFSYALGQSFFSLSLGMGTIITYGSYIRKDENLVASGSYTAVSDLFFALLAGLAIMPAVFAAGIEPVAGPGLIYQSVPFIFSSLGSSLPVVSTIASIAFFLAVVVAALTSMMSTLEVGMSFLSECYGIERSKGAIILFLICGSVGTLCSLSFGPLSGVTFKDMNIFDMCDGLCSNVLLLVLAFLAVVFVGFVMKKEDVRDEITNGGTMAANGKLFPVIYFLIRWVAPIAIAAIFVTNFIF